jgi:hypothetical protein
MPQFSFTTSWAITAGSRCAERPSFPTLRVLVVSRRLLFVARGRGIVDRSTTGLSSGGFSGRSADGRPAQRIRQDVADELKHLAKVRVAGSNPVFRSNGAPGRGGFRGLPVLRNLEGSATSPDDDRAQHAPVRLAGVEQSSDPVLLEVAEAEANAFDALDQVVEPRNAAGSAGAEASSNSGTASGRLTSSYLGTR